METLVEMEPTRRRRMDRVRKRGSLGKIGTAVMKRRMVRLRAA